MAISPDSYGSVAGVAAYVKHLTNASGAFDAATKPTLAQVEAFIDDQSATLNGCLASAGYVVPATQATVVRVLAKYANLGAAGLAELSQRSGGYSKDDQNKRENKFLAEFDKACAWIMSGAPQALGAALIATGELADAAAVGELAQTAPIMPAAGSLIDANNPIYRGDPYTRRRWRP